MDIFVIKKQLQRFGKKIDQAVEIADWVLLTELLIERQHYIETIFNEAVVPEAVKTELKVVLQGVLANDNQLVQIINNQKKQMHQKIQMLNQGKKSIQLYWNNE